MTDQLHPACSIGPGYTFCAPSPAKGFFLAVHPQRPQADDARFIQDLFRRRSLTPTPASTSFSHPAIPQGARLYRVDAFLPKIVRERTGTTVDLVGPNCYATALTASGKTGFADRYVDKAEFRYFIARDYEAVVANAPERLGDIVVYDGHGGADAGEHAAALLIGGLVFHKGGFSRSFPYEIVPITGALTAMDAAYVPPREDRFFPKPKPKPRAPQRIDRHRLRSNPTTRMTTATARDRTLFLPLMRSYEKRLQRVCSLTWSHFSDARLDLLSMENIGHLLRAFEKRLKEKDIGDDLLKLDPTIAETYLRLKSLSYQYDAMIAAYCPIKETRRTEALEALYRTHYVRFDRHFDREIAAHLKACGVHGYLHRAVRDRVVDRIKTYDPVRFAASDGAKGIPFYRILSEEIERVTGSPAQGIVVE